MIYYQGYTVSFQEVPDEVSLVISIADCPHKCPGCHSPELQKREGDNLLRDLPKLISEYKDAVTCICFMGEGQDVETMHALIKYAHNLGYKTCWYTGRTPQEKRSLPIGLDYYKYGPYIEELGGLDSPTTNQRMIKFEWGPIYRPSSDPDCVCDVIMGVPTATDITYKFQHKKD